MSPRDQDRWKNEMLSEVLIACAMSDVLRPVLIFKGARILSRRLMDEGRMSFDLDSTFTEKFALGVSSEVARADFLGREIPHAVSTYFGGFPIIRLSLVDSEVTTIRNPFGWTGYRVRLRIRDAEKASVLSLPSIDLDVGAPEKFSPTAISPLPVDDHFVCAYTLERIAGEKLRAFLTSLPSYRRKINGRGTAVRVRDLYDLARILAARPIAETAFWKRAAEDFRQACECRYVDCAGLSTFWEQKESTEQAYTRDPTLPKDILFFQAEAALFAIITAFENAGVLPFQFPIPRQPS